MIDAKHQIGKPAQPRDLDVGIVLMPEHLNPAQRLAGQCKPLIIHGYALSLSIFAS